MSLKQGENVHSPIESHLFYSTEIMACSALEGRSSGARCKENIKNETDMFLNGWTPLV